MDLVTAAGIGLSVTSLAFQLFSGCVKGYQLLLDAADMPNEVEHLCVRMRLEQIRLLTWGDKVGLLEDVLTEPSFVLQLHRNLIFDVLLEISRLLKACIRIDKKSTRSGSMALENTANMPPHVPLLCGNDASSMNVKRLLNKALTSSGELPKRLSWAMIYRDKFKMLVQQLISYNDSITSLLDRSSLQQIQHTQMQSHLTLLHLSTQVNDLTQVVQAMRIEAIEEDSIVSTQQSRSYLQWASKPTSVGQGLALSQLAAFKADRLRIEDTESVPMDALISEDELQILTHYSTIDTAIYQDRYVWIEWKEFDQTNLNPWWKSVVNTRVKKLASLLSISNLPKEFRAPRCLGCFQVTDDDGFLQYGFVHEVPPAVSKTAHPQSLLHLIKYKSMPSLTERIELAVSLSNSLLYLHSVNWLHKGIRSENVIFFSHDEDPVDYTSPILAGFEYARPDLPNELTEKPQNHLDHDIYRHPLSLLSSRERSQKSWDIYSLGVVLVEIALWRCISDITSINLRDIKAKSKVRRVKDLLLQDEYLNKVAAHCGHRYRAAVELCLSLADRFTSVGDTRDDENVRATDLDLEVIQVFAKDVRGVLQGIET